MHFLYPVLLLYQQSIYTKKIKIWGKTVRACAWSEPPPAPITGILFGWCGKKTTPPLAK